MSMRLKPTSMPMIVLTGFLLVATPLSMAVVLGIVYVDRLSSQSERLVARGIQVTRHSQRLKEHVVAMERIARQYQVLGDASLIGLYEERHQQFLEVLKSLERFRIQGVSEWNLGQMRGDSEMVLSGMRQYAPDSEDFDASLHNFSRMADLASAISREGNEFIDKELLLVQETASSAQRYLSWSVIAVLPGVAILIVIFTFLFSRPLRLLSNAIKDLGAGRFEKTIRIAGPPDELEELGEQLDWLRGQLLALDEEKALFLRHMSHELKTPLASIRESGELLNDGMLGSLTDRQQEVVGLLRHNSLELEHLIENLLLLNVWQEGGPRLDSQPVDVCALIQDILSRYQVSIEVRGLLVEARCEGVTMDGDPLRLRMMINNLISNAVKYSPVGGRIEIRSQVGSDHVTLLFSDQGPGIPAEEQELVFKPFYQGRQKHGGYVRGTGIGLSVVRECVRAHRGEVKIMPARTGAHFHIRLPLLAGQD